MMEMGGAEGRLPPGQLGVKVRSTHEAWNLCKGDHYSSLSLRVQSKISKLQAENNLTMGDAAALRNTLSQTENTMPGIQSSSREMMRFYDKPGGPELAVSEWRS
eukprot:scaffold5803_cov156-Skeletonema_menzelii.AAC.1